MGTVNVGTTCPLCGLRFSNGALLELHVREDHSRRAHRTPSGGATALTDHTTMSGQASRPSSHARGAAPAHAPISQDSVPNPVASRTHQATTSPCPPDIEGVAIHGGPEPCVGDPRGRSEALAGVRAGQPLSREITVSGCRRRPMRRKATSPAALARAAARTPRGLRPCACTEFSCASQGQRFDPEGAISLVLQQPLDSGERSPVSGTGGARSPRLIRSAPRWRRWIGRAWTTR